MRPVYQRARRAALPALGRPEHLAAPVLGLNAVAPISSMPPQYCVQLWNMLASEYGLRARLGSREWANGLTGAGDNFVRTVIPFKGSAANGAADKLFAATSSGIWDITSSGGASLLLSFGITSGRAGHGICHAHVTTVGGHYLIYCDEENGYHVYSQDSGTWAAVTMGGGGSQISGVDPASVVAVLSFKQRLWLVLKDSSDLYYLSAGAVFGPATKFAVGSQFRAGGPVRNVYDWTYDRSGLDDSLVIVSDGGDVLIYQGTDPSSSLTWGLRGKWYAGDLPAGREIAISLSGDLLLLTRLGLLPLSKLVVGANQYATDTIGPLFNAAMLSKATIQGWTLRLHPEENALVVTVPEAEGTPTNQLVMSLSKGNGWARYRDLPIYSSAVFGGKFYFGTVDGSVYINDGYVDGLTLAAPTESTPVQYAGLSSFQNLGAASQKQIHLIRPYFLGESSQPSFNAEARYNFNFNEMAPVSPTAGAGDVWDTAIWDTAVWGGDYAASSGLRGAVGMGVHAAIAWRGAAVSRTVLAGFDVYFQQGGFL